MRGDPEVDSFIIEQNGKHKTTSRKDTGTLGRGGMLEFTRKGGWWIQRVRLVEEWRDTVVSIRKEIWGRLHSGPDI